MNKADYLRKKGLLPKENLPYKFLYVVNSTRKLVEINEYEIWDIEELYDKKLKCTVKDFKCIYPNENNPFFIGKYEFIMIDEKSEDYGHGSGMGDLWCWSHYAFFDKEQALECFKKEQERVKQKYHKGE